MRRRGGWEKKERGTGAAARRSKGTQRMGKQNAGLYREGPRAAEFRVGAGNASQEGPVRGWN